MAKVHRGRSSVSVGIVVVSTVATTLQFIQTTDSTFPLLYFTVDSSLFAALVSITTLVGHDIHKLAIARCASTVSVLISAFVFAVIIAPQSENGTWIQSYDDSWVRIATFLFHLLMPALVVIDFFVRGAFRLGLMRAIFGSIAWPLLYFATIGLISGLTSVAMPYPFLDPGATGAFMVAVSVTALAVVFCCCALALCTVGRACSRRKQLAQSKSRLRSAELAAELQGRYSGQ